MTSIKIDGLRELDAALSQFSKSTARNVLTRALRNAAKPIADDARRGAPVDTGALRDSIAVQVVRGPSAGKAAFAEAMSSGASRSEAAAAARAANRQSAGQPLAAVVRVAAKAPHAIFAEFGTRRHRGTMFLSRAANGESKAVVKLLSTELAIEIEKTAKRIAARQQRKENR